MSFVPFGPFAGDGAGLCPGDAGRRGGAGPGAAGVLGQGAHLLDQGGCPAASLR